MRRITAGFPVQNAIGGHLEQLLKNTLTEAVLLAGRHSAAVFADQIKKTDRPRHRETPALEGADR